MRLRTFAGAFALAGLIAPSIGNATDGYFSHGYGMKGKGRGGASTAMTDDTFGGANNPATMAFAGGRLDLGLDWFRPDRNSKRQGSAGGAGFLDGSADGNERQDFFIPEFGYSRVISPSFAVGITVYGNGGMNTDYPSGQLDAGICQGLAPNGVGVNLLCGQGNLGVDLSQLIIAPTFAWKLNQQHSIGVSPLIGYQRFKAYGLSAFGLISTDPNNLTNKGYDDAWGFGVRFGWYGKLADNLSAGAAFSTKIYMQEFGKYKGLFAESGDFDIPANLNLGIAFKATPELTIMADYQRIFYGDVDSIANSSVNTACAGGNLSGCLGGGSGLGFGWRDVNVWKLGIEYAVNKNLTLRAGYNHTDNPIRSEDVTFNILAPGVVQDHLTLGFTYALGADSEITMAYMHAFENSVSGPTNPVYFPVGGNETLTMSQDSLGIAWSKRF